MIARLRADGLVDIFGRIMQWVLMVLHTKGLRFVVLENVPRNHVAERWK